MAQRKCSERWGIALALITLVWTAGCSALVGPSQQAVAAGLVRSADFARLNSLGFSDEKVQRAARCTAEAIGGKLSKEALQAIAHGKFDSQLSKADYSKLTQAISSCSLNEADTQGNAAGGATGGAAGGAGK
ncbi:MAG: hypothetical protein MR006_05880 [Arcanobacterium sp.]|nr:hypothetical protein [Arcanobacterium sp.]MDY5589509.1 hypothetical protein [Arcanobacterium sp.]